MPRNKNIKTPCYICGTVHNSKDLINSLCNKCWVEERVSAIDDIVICDVINTYYSEGEKLIANCY